MQRLADIALCKPPKTPEWVRGIYDFAALPDLTFFFNAQLEVSLQRILEGRPQLKYFEAGMDLRLATDPYESFRIFQGRILEQYLAMSPEFRFHMIDANQQVEVQQAIESPQAQDEAGARRRLPDRDGGAATLVLAELLEALLVYYCHIRHAFPLQWYSDFVVGGVLAAAVGSSLRKAAPPGQHTAAASPHPRCPVLSLPRVKGRS